MIDPGLAHAFDASWPAAEIREAGGFRVGRGQGGGRRVGAAHAAGGWSPDDIAAAEAVHRGWQQPALFRVDDGDERLAEALRARGYDRHDPTAILEAPLALLTDREVPQVTAFAVWPPLAIQREIWAAGGIGPARLAVMARVRGPRAAVLGRIEDRAAGSAFVAVSDGIAMLHALEILPPWRRKGLAGWMLRQAALWAADAGAGRMALSVTRANGGALALYRGLGFNEIAGYAYYSGRG